MQHKNHMRNAMQHMNLLHLLKRTRIERNAMPYTARDDSEKNGTNKAAYVADAVKNGIDKNAGLTRDALNAGTQNAIAFNNDLQKRMGAAGEAQRDTMRKSAEGSAEFGKFAMELFSEQARHNTQFVKAFVKMFDWNEAVRVQSEFVRDSFERFSTLNSRYLGIFQGVMKTANDSAKEQTKKAA